MSHRVAQCACGRVSLKAHGEPIKVIACHCDNCQKRTGSVFQVSCWYPTDSVDDITGETRTFNGLEVDGVGPGIAYRFCATCGSTVYWTIDGLPDIYGIAVGNFVDPQFPIPTMDVHTGLRHHWVAPVPEASAFEEWPPPEAWS
jgi:hypothetical protein